MKIILNLWSRQKEIFPACCFWGGYFYNYFVGKSSADVFGLVSSHLKVR